MSQRTQRLLRFSDAAWIRSSFYRNERCLISIDIRYSVRGFLEPSARGIVMGSPCHGSAPRRPPTSSPYEAHSATALERRKIYPVLPDREAAAHRQLRVIDESGEDYLYPAAMFAPTQLPLALRRAVLGAV